MGACASAPKDLGNKQKLLPPEEPLSPKKSQPEPDKFPQVSVLYNGNGGETAKKEEQPLVDVTETPSKEQEPLVDISEPEPAQEASTESKRVDEQQAPMDQPLEPSKETAQKEPENEAKEGDGAGKPKEEAPTAPVSEEKKESPPLVTLS
ncbi:phosphatidylinositol transfer protein sfh5-like [Diospyros lotus]|uniref:phosphatidylinositol transfer protein sfh5-like n=1 Tax=Diospyros lotus TaxID=55363 RepID=UPI00224DBDA1|nr:phosphatidylinositol transfer protein sfh5-like [Diospyros lotus]